VQYINALTETDHCSWWRIDSYEQSPSSCFASICKAYYPPRVHAADEPEPGGESQAERGARDGDVAVFQRLAHDFEDVAAEFGQFVEKEYAVVSISFESDL
jgi:hypothetical protein